MEATSMTHQNMPAISAENNTPVAYKGVPVMTTERLAEAFGATAKMIQNNYDRNGERFTEGTHLFKVKGADLKALKTDPLWEGQFGDRTPILILWTERGAMNHAKILETPEAWGVYGQLVDTYFAVKEGKALAAPAAAPMRAIVSDFRAYQSAAKLFGMDKNQAAISANMAVMKRHGVSLAEDLGASHLIAPQQVAHMTATQIGEAMGGISARAINKLLSAYGYQEPDHTCDAGYRMTNKGTHFGIWVDVARPNGTGTSRQLRWLATIVPALISAQESRI